MARRIFTKWTNLFLALVLLFCSVILFLWDFSSYTERQLERELHGYMRDLRDQSAASLSTNMDFLTDELLLEARQFSMRGALTDEEILAELKFFSQGNYVTRCTILTPEGQVYSSEFGMQKIDPTPYRDAILRDTLHIGDPRLHAPSGQYLIDISAPLYLDGAHFGSLSISYDRENLQKLFGTPALKADCAISLVTSNGIVIGRMSARPCPIPPGENYLDFHRSPKVLFTEGSPEALESDFSTHRSGKFQCTIEGLPYFVSYAPTQVNNWYVAVSATDVTLQEQTRGFQRMAGLLTIKIVGVLALGALLFVLYSLRERRMLAKLKDSYRLALTRSNDLFYEVDLEHDSFVDRSRRLNAFFEAEPGMKYSAFIHRYAEFCAPADRQDFLDHLLTGSWTVPRDSKGILSAFEYRAVTKAGSEFWYRCTVLPMEVSGERVQKIICIATDVTNQKRITANLQNAAKRDGLTHLYNKVAAEELICDFFRNEGRGKRHALFIMDVDFFKHVNDNHGHAKGDQVITEFARTISACFRKSDILGRIGGDEFIALLKDYNDVEQVAAKAQEINDAIRTANYGEDDKGVPCTASMSIGIALYGNDGNDFNLLFHKADHALYASKRSGRDRYTFYQDMDDHKARN